MEDIHNHNKFETEPQDKICCGKKVRTFRFDVIDSTNNWAKEQYAKWEATGVTVVTANQQTGGRGRFNRRWESPAGVNLYATFAFWGEVGEVPLILAISAAQLMEHEGFSAKIKWPNDLLLDGKKVGGILCETIDSHQRRGVICGIGLNINMDREVAEKIDQPATSLLIVGGKKCSVSEMTSKLIDYFISNMLEYETRGFDIFYDEYVKKSYFRPGDRLTLQDGVRVIEGVFVGYDSTGALILSGKSGEINTYLSGEIVSAKTLTFEY